MPVPVWNLTCWVAFLFLVLPAQKYSGWQSLRGCMLWQGKKSFVPLPNAEKAESRGGSLCYPKKSTVWRSGSLLQVGFGTNTENQVLELHVCLLKMGLLLLDESYLGQKKNEQFFNYLLLFGLEFFVVVMLFWWGFFVCFACFFLTQFHLPLFCFWYCALSQTIQQKCTQNPGIICSGSQSQL